MSRTSYILMGLGGFAVVLIGYQYGAGTLLLLTILAMVSVGCYWAIQNRAVVSGAVGGRAQSVWNRVSPHYQSVIEGQKRPGIFIDPVTWHTVVRPVACVIGAVVAMLLLFIIFSLLRLWPGIPLPLWWCPIIGALYGVWAFDGDEDEGEEVPFNYAAAVTLAGIPLYIFRTTKDYSWVGKRLFLGRLSRVLEPGTDDKGFLFMGPIQIRIWNDSDDTEKALVLGNVAKNTADVYGTLTVVIGLLDLVKWLRSDNPLLDIAERARSAFRTAIAFFIDKDAAAAKNVLGKLMSGWVLISAFLSKRHEGHIKGSMVRDASDVPMYEPFMPDPEAPESEEDQIQAAKDKFLTRVKNEGDEDMLKVLPKRNGDFVIISHRVDDTLEPVLEAAGAILFRSTIGDITLSDKVREEANKAASEADQMAAQIASAQTMKEVRKTLRLTKAQRDNPSYQDALFVAAAQDLGENSPIKVVHVTGTNHPLTRGLIANGQAAMQPNQGGNS